MQLIHCQPAIDNTAPISISNSLPHIMPVAFTNSVETTHSVQLANSFEPLKKVSPEISQNSVSYFFSFVLQFVFYAKLMTKYYICGPTVLKLQNTNYGDTVLISSILMKAWLLHLRRSSKILPFFRVQCGLDSAKYCCCAADNTRRKHEMDIFEILILSAITKYRHPRTLARFYRLTH